MLRSYKPKSKERLSLIAGLRKQGYFHLQMEKGITNPVRNSKNPRTEYFTCSYYLRYYSRRILYRHVKICTNRPPEVTNPGKNCLTNSQTLMATISSRNQDFLKTSRIKKEVFGIMRPDEISHVAKKDPVICLYGERLLNKHKRQQIATVVSNKVREMARLLISVKNIRPEIKNMYDAIRPELFQYLVYATKNIAGFDIETRTFKSPSLALHMGTNLIELCSAVYKAIMEKKQPSHYCLQ